MEQFNRPAYVEDERYIGTYVIGKRAVTEIGGHRIRLKDESEWYKIPDHIRRLSAKSYSSRQKPAYAAFLSQTKSSMITLYAGKCSAAAATMHCHGLHNIRSSIVGTPR